MEKIPYLRIGVITTSHGVRGAVRVFPTTDPDRFDTLRRCFLDTGKEMLELDVVSCGHIKGLVILQFAQLTSIDDVMPYKGKELFVAREDAVPLEEGEYYIADLIGLQVVTDEGRTLGVMEDMMETGANDVYIVRAEDEKEILLPAIPDCIKNIDLDAGTMLVHILPGLLDI